MVRLIFLNLVFFISGALVAQQVVESENISNFKGIISTMLQFRPNAQPSSSGLYGSTIGFSTDTINAPDAGEYSNYHLNGYSEEILMNQVHWQKGTTFPLDFGLGLGQDQGRTITTWYGFLQWTLYESFMHPSLVTRVFYNQAYNFSGVNAHSSGLELAGGYSIFSFLSMFLNIGAHSENISISRLSRNDQLSLIRTAEGSLSKSDVSEHLRYGLQVRLYFPYLNFKIEDHLQNKSSGTQRSPTVSIHLGY